MVVVVAGGGGDSLIGVLIKSGKFAFTLESLAINKKGRLVAEWSKALHNANKTPTVQGLFPGLGQYF